MPRQRTVHRHIVRGWRRPIARVTHLLLDRFLLLPVGAVIALLWANTGAESYFILAHALSLVVNEIGMAFFFALLAQEIVEAVMPGGALHSWRRWSMPIVAAVGGISGAVFVYLWHVHLAYEEMLSPAWPVACAVDAAATYYVLKTIMPRSGAVPFALLLAIVTDIVGLIIVAPRHLILQARVGGAALVTASLLLAALMRALKVRSFWPYLLVCGPLSWVAFYWEGLHPAFALIPIVMFLPHRPRRGDVFADPADVNSVRHTEHQWNLLVQVVVFFFGLVNAGVILRGYGTGSWAVLSSALVGRTVGILLAVGVAGAAGLHLPQHVGGRELLVVALATSSGFAMALFFATGILATGSLLEQIKIGIIVSSAGAFLAFAAAWAFKIGAFAP